MSTLISERSYDAEVLRLWEHGTNLLPLEDVAVWLSELMPVVGADKRETGKLQREAKRVRRDISHALSPNPLVVPILPDLGVMRKNLGSLVIKTRAGDPAL